MKKFALIVVVLLIICVGVLLALPYFLHDKLEALAKKELNASILGKADFNHLGISFFKNFPDATVSLTNLYITSAALPTDTLVRVVQADVVISSYKLLTKGHVDLTSVKLVKPNVDAHIDYYGKTNFAIMPEDTSASTSTGGQVTLHLRKIEVEQGSFAYHDVYTDTRASLSDLTFVGAGELSSDKFDFKLDARAGSVSLVYESRPYFDNKILETHFELNVDRLQNVYAINRGDLRINNFPVSITGSVADKASRYSVDVAFNSPQSDFKNLLSLFNFLQNDLQKIDARGAIAFTGSVRGDYVPATDSIPMFDVKLEVKDASFRIDSLKDSIQNIHVDFRASNRIGLIDSTELGLDSIYFRVRDHAVEGHAHIHRLVNSVIDARLTGSVHADEILQVYPIPALHAEGKLNFDLAVKGTYAQLEEDIEWPQLDFDIDLADGMIRYDTLPDSLSHISFHLAGHSPQGNWKSGELSVEKLKLKIGDNPVAGNLAIKNFKTPYIDAFFEGQLHLEDILKVVPLDSTEMRGLISATVKAKGVYDPDRGAFPKVAGNVLIDNAFLKVAGVDHALEDVRIDAVVKNPTGQLEATRLDIRQFKFMLDNKFFEGSGWLSDFKDFGYYLNLKGAVDLEKISKFYPVADVLLAGEVACAVEVAGKISDLQQGAYERTKASGYIAFTNVRISGKKLPETITIPTARITVSPQKIFLENFNVTSGSSSFTLTGNMADYFCFFKDDGDLVTASLQLTADTLDLNEWKPAFVTLNRGEVSLSQPAVTAYSAWQVPSTIDFVFNSTVGVVKYEDMVLENMLGTIRLRDGVLSMTETGFSSLKSKFAANGTYNSRDVQRPQFSFALNIEDLDIKSAYNNIRLIRELLPAAADAEGIFSINYALEGELDAAMSPKTATLKGAGTIHIADAKINGMKLFERLSKAARKKEMNDPHLRDFTMDSEIRNNKIFVKPFNLKVAGFNTEIEGVNDLKGTVNYVVKVQLLPLDKLRIPFNVSGPYDNPKVALGKGHKLPEEQPVN